MHVVFKENNIESIIHFAALKAVGESVEKPIEYYSNNLISTLNLFELMREYGVKSLYLVLQLLYMETHILVLY